MVRPGVHNMNGHDLHEEISHYKSSVKSAREQLKREEAYLAEVQEEEELRIKRFSDDLKASTERFMENVLEGKIVIPELDRVYLKETIWRKFGRSEPKHSYHYCKVFNFCYGRREVGRNGKKRILEKYPTNICSRKDFYVPTKIENLADAERSNIGASRIVIRFEISQTSLNYDDLAVIFWYYYAHERLDAIEAIKKLEEYSSGVTHDNYLRELYLDKVYGEHDAMEKLSEWAKNIEKS